MKRVAVEKEITMTALFYLMFDAWISHYEIDDDEAYITDKLIQEYRKN